MQKKFFVGFQRRVGYDLVEESNTNVKKYCKEPSIELSDCPDAFQWSKIEKDVIKYKRNGHEIKEDEEVLK